VKPTLFSGAQPTGHMTLGNYIGAIKNWKHLQDDYNCLFCIVDLHALTSGILAQDLVQNTINTFALFIACGLDHKKNTIFAQSAVSAHTELAWILQTNTGMGELQRMTQFKDKSQRYAGQINLGLFTYPTLMAADILLYQTQCVPVGDDQKQHLELTRDIADRFNKKYSPIFTIPQPYIDKGTARIMSLQEPTKKMSKSDLNQGACINILDDESLILKKIKRAVTDSEATIRHDSNRPGIANLVNIYSAISNKKTTDIENEYTNQGYGKFKNDLAEIIIAEFAPIKQEYIKLIADKAHLLNLMEQGAEKAREQADKTLTKVKKNIGLF
jgi:tryptophanyl-tRNA synthetase